MAPKLHVQRLVQCVGFISHPQKVQADLALCPSIFPLCSSAQQVCRCSRGGSGAWDMLCPSPHLVLPHSPCTRCHELLVLPGEWKSSWIFLCELGSHWILECQNWQCGVLGAWHCCRLIWSFWAHIYPVSFPLEAWAFLNGLKVFSEVKIPRLLEYVLNNRLLKWSGKSFVDTNVFPLHLPLLNNAAEQVTALGITGRYFNLVHSSWVICL